MSIKSIALIAATVAVTAGAASANQLPFGENLDAGNTLELGTVTADNAGFVEIYDYSKGVRGDLLGVEAVRAGANTNVKVDVGIFGNDDVLAVLTANGQEVLTKDYDIN